MILSKLTWFVFGYNIVNTGFERENEFESAFDNTNIDCGDFCDGIITCINTFDDALSPSTSSLTLAQRQTVFDLKEIGTDCAYFCR